MNPNIVSTNEAFKRFCTGRGCNNHAVRQLVIKYVHKSGWFCDACSADLIKLGLANEEG
jgi:hypothetical protein